MARADREGRGRLSKIDQLPEEADEAIAWANEQLRKRKLPANVIFTEFNERLADVGVDPVSKSSFNRYSVRKAIQFRRMDEARRMAADVVGELGPEGADEVTIMVAEMLKLAIFERIEKGKLDSKGIMELGRGLSSVVGAQKTSAEYRRRLQDELLAQVDKAIAKASDEGAAGADAAAVLKRIREDVYGIFEKAAP